MGPAVVRQITVSQMRKGMVIRGGKPRSVFLTLSDWRPAKPGSSAYLNGYRKSVIDCLVLTHEGYPEKMSFTTEMWTQRGTGRTKRVEVLWDLNEDQA